MACGPKLMVHVGPKVGSLLDKAEPRLPQFKTPGADSSSPGAPNRPKKVILTQLSSGPADNLNFWPPQCKDHRNPKKDKV